MSADLDSLREQAAAWYEREAARPDGGAFGRMAAEWAAKVRAGQADHRLADLIACQAECDRQHPIRESLQ